MIRKIAFGMAAAIAMAVSASGAANAQVCSKYVYAGTGNISITAIGARMSARKAWRTNVARRLGARYASTSRALRAREICNKVGKRAQCRYLAKPCRA